MDKIIIKGARTHNLKNISLEIPKNKFIVITGMSGSGKSSLAFDTIFREGQRRYMESVSSYVRQFLGQMEKPDVDKIIGLSPAIAIEQKGKSYNPRSTVGTMTEIYDYMRVLFSKIGTQYCYNCGKKVSSQSIQEIVDNILAMGDGEKIIITAPFVKGKKGEYKELFTRMQNLGFNKVWVDGEIYNLEEEISLDKNKKHKIYLVIDRLRINKESRSRLSDSIETAMKQNNSREVIVIKGEEEIFFSEGLSCPDCGISFESLHPRNFSFNNPYGSCPECSGLGVKMDFDIDLIIPDKTKSIRGGAIKIFGFGENSFSFDILESLANYFKFSLDEPYENLDEKYKNILLYGNKLKIKFMYGDNINKHEFYRTFEGIINILWRRYKQTTSSEMKFWYEKYMKVSPCPLCHGKRLKKEALAVKILDKNIMDISGLEINKIKIFFDKLLDENVLKNEEKHISLPLIKEINTRLDFLIEVGLGYLTLDRKSNTLSGGESQRIHLASEIGQGLSGVLYVLDEPSIGLHQRDNKRLLNTIKKLKDLGNTVIVVEHDEDTIKEADFIVDIGPYAGVNGGEIVGIGTLDDIISSEKSLTGKYLKKELFIPAPKIRRKPKGVIKILGARENNLKNIDVDIPLGVLVSVSGVSGSGKSTLVEEILYKNLMNKIYNSNKNPGNCREIKNLDLVDKVINIDQAPIGKTPRSNPITYTGLWTDVRELFAMTNEARIKGYKPGRFSFNVKGGRCEACQGDGVKKVEMHFLPDVYVECDVCQGKRFERETLDVKYKGKNISDILEMTIDEGYKFFEKIPRLERGLKLLLDVGLGYMKLGQSSTTLSGGEAQRIKLASELFKRSTGKTIYILDEPTTGLHFHDIYKLVEVLEKLVEKGNTVLVIEHNLDILKISDYIIDLGPEGGNGGGKIVGCGTPEEIVKIEKSYTGQFLKNYLS